MKQVRGLTTGEEHEAMISVCDVAEEERVHRGGSLKMITFGVLLQDDKNYAVILNCEAL